MKPKNVEDVYPLAPTQQGVLFHSLYDPGSAMYFEIITWTIHGEVNIEAFGKAWQSVVNRHPILRTFFVWEGLEEPLQVVRKQVKLPLRYEDWRGLTSEVQQEKVAEFYAEERARGFDLSTAPLMRVALIQLDENVYRFVWSYHHVLIDGWSSSVIFNDTFNFYKTLAQGQELKVEPGRPFRDYIVWLRQQDLSQAEAYWRRTLAGFGEPTTLGAGNGKASETHTYAEEQLSLSAETSEALQAFARRHQLTLNTLFQGAWAILLNRYSGARDVVFGVAVSGRPPGLREVESMVGMLVNTLPARIEVRREATLLAWLRELQEQQVTMRKYEYTPLMQIQQWSEVANGTPLFESIVGFENHPIESSLGTGNGQAELRDIVHYHTATGYALNVMIEPGRELLLKIMYDAGRFEAAAIGQMLRHFQVLLESSVAHPEARLDELEMLAPGELQQLVTEWSGVRTTYPRESSIQELFEAEAERRPEAVAVSFGAEQLTYRELNERANQLAHHLRGLGVGPEVLVGLCVERSLELIVGLLGILKAGGAYAPLDPGYPPERLAFMLADSAAPVLVTQEWFADLLPVQAQMIVCLDSDWDQIATASTENPENQNNADSLAYLIYTSGSTGQPKGIGIPHRGVVRLVRNTNYSGFGPEETFLQIAPISFDASTFEVWGSLLNGGRLVVMPPDPPSLEELGRALKEHGITTLFLTTGLFHLMANSQLESLLGLRRLLSGGEVLSPQAVRQVVEVESPLTFCDIYGPTENTTYSTFCPIEPGVAYGASVPIGKPINNTQVYVLDSELRPTPAGVPGELYLGGDGLARGYHQRPELTAERFVPDPFSGVAGARLYRTGDRVRFLADGNIEFIGRFDNQVKVRGFRIELGEIETVLARHAAIKEVVVEVRGETSEEKRLVAYVVSKAEAELSPEDLRQYLSQRVPDYMVPNNFVLLERLPLTTNGKVDRKALPEPDSLRPELAESYVAPGTQVEQQLAEIWSKVLGVERIGVNDNFFELGGHSLLATQFISTVREQFQIELPLRVIFDSPTVAGMAEHITASLSEEHELSAPIIAATTRDRDLPLSFAQRRMWFLNQLEPESAYYNVPLAMRLSGRLDPKALEQAINEVMRRHEVLRTTFETRDGEPVQVINEDVHLELTVEDFSGADEDRVIALVAEESAKPFELSRWPLLRMRLLKLGPEEHVAVFIVHHIISDGWSMGVLVREVAALYAAFVENKPSPLPELPLQYADFAAWQQEWLRDNVLEEQLQYWKKQLSGAPTVLDLPTDRPRPAMQKFRGANEVFAVPKAVTEQLLTMSRQEGATLFMTLLAAFNVLLYRYSGQQDILLGTPIANRNRAEIEGLIGFFVNTLVLRARLESDESFLSLLRQIRGTTLDAYAHQDLPFEKLVQELQPERDMSRSPLFQAMLVLQNAPQQAFALPDLTLSAFETSSRTAKFDLMLTLTEGPDGLVGDLEYDTDLFETATIKRLLGHFQTLLESVAVHPEQRLMEYSLMAADESQQLLREWNATEVDYPREHCLHELFELQAARTPEAEALISGAERLTYKELNERANRVAHHLRRLGTGPESLVGVMLERSTALLVALLGVLKSGAAYVPLDPAYPRERLRFMLEDAGAKVLLTQQSLRDELPAHAARVVCLDMEWENIATESHENPTINIRPGNLAYTIYTSGSTGKPKGAAIEHQSAVTLVHWARECFAAEQLSGVLASTSVCFDLSIFELFVPLAAGGKVILAANALELPNLAAAGEVTLINTVPSAMAELVHMGGVPDSVRVVNLAGEPLQKVLVERIYELNTVEQVVNLYGPSEDTTYSTWALIERGDSRAPTIGRPIANTQVYVLDAQQKPVPMGIVGELYISGAGLARGYLDRPQLTAEKFLPNPFASAPGARMYRTGDLVRYLPDGRLEFTGRADQQVKIRGFRIEPGEVEALLSQQDGVNMTAVMVHTQANGDKRLVAYVTALPGRVLSTEELRRRLKEQLPDYMVPTTFVMLEQMPLTPNGKINRRALPAPEAQVEPANGYVAPRNSVEELLSEVWTEVLGVNRVSTNRNFFELGGHSLLATRVTSRVREMFGVDLPVRSVFETPTISGMSRKILADMFGGRLEQPRQIKSLPRNGDDLPLSSAQERLWFLEQFESAGSAYHIPVVVRIEGQLDIEALQHTLAELVRRHESLRTTFVNIDGEPRQRIAAAMNVDLPIIDLSTLPEDQREAEAVRYSSEQAQQPFDLSSGPLLRTTLIRLSAKTHVFALTLHHIISDGWSIGVLVREAAALYEAYATGKESPLEELPVQYADFAAWQRDWLRDEVLQNQVEYWRNLLGDMATAIELPTDHPRPPVQSFRGDVINFALTPELTAKLKEISKQEDVTLFMTLLAAFRILLYRSTGQEAIAIGTPIANRQNSAVENLIGFFVNTLALRIDITGDMTFRELLARVREVTLGAYAHQDVPFEKLVEELQPERVRNLHPLFQVMFAVQNTPLGVIDLPGLTFSAQDFEHGATRFDLECHMRELDNRLYGQLVFSTDLFTRESAALMLKHFENLLDGISAGARITTLPFFTEDEQQQLHAAWHGPVTEFPRDKGIHHLFEAQAECTPDDVALVFHDEELTYRELDQRATQLARYLRKQGVGPDMVVGVCIERSLEMIVGALGVLKAGGAYLGLDPAYPQERLQLMLDDAQAHVLVTQERFSTRFAATPRIYIDKDWPEICAEREAELPANMSSNQLAFVVFTSGSTGRPKGVAITHIALANLITWQVARNPIKSPVPRNTARPQPRTLQFASLSFDVSFQEIFSTWAAGGTLVLADEDVRHDPKALLRVLTEQRIQSVDVPYVVLQYLAELATTDNITLPDLRYFIAAGEQLKITPAIRRFFEQLNDCALDNHYGPSETHVVCTHMLEGPPSTWPELPPIGRSEDNARIYVLDKQMQPVPFGVVGEVYIGGAQLARGYVNQPALTAERFVPDPFSVDEPGRRLYRTGDLARLLTDGNFEFIGRNDFQIKLRGHRIELGEVEAALRRERFVREAVVKTHRNARGEEALVAFLLVEPDSRLQVNELQDRLEKQLPPHMIPSAFVCLDEFPLTQTGKIDSRALHATDDLLQTSYTGYLAPRTPHEEMVAAIWAEVLNLARVGVTDNFFHLGGHSLLATRVMSRVRKVFNLELPLYKLFEAPTVVRFAEEIVAALAVEPEQEPLPPIEHVPDIEAPVSFEQERLWVWDQFNPGSPIYNLTYAFRLHGQLNTVAFEETFNEIVRRHDALRTTFQASKSGPRQIVSPWTPVSLPVTDLSKLSEDEKEAEMKRQQEVHALHNFDLARGPLMLVSLLRLSEEEHVSLITMHHIISDGWSVGVLLHEVTALYEAFNTGRPATLGELQIQYPDFARWQRRWVETRSLPYWTKQLDPLPPAIELPWDYERPDTMSFRGNSVFFNISSELLANLQALSRRQNVTLYMTLLAAFKALLHRYSGQTDIVIGGGSANRTQIELEKLIGFFVNMLVLRTDVSGDPKFTELLQRVREVTLGAYAHQHTPYAALVTELKVKREWNRNSLFQAAFVLQNAPLGEVELRGLTVSHVQFKCEFSPFDMVVSLSETDGGIAATLSYSEELFKRDTIELLLNRYSNLLASIVANPDERLSQLELHGYVETADYSLPQFLTDLRPREMDKLLMKIGISGD